jgi:PadR family transcriptional regulator PadR
MAANPKMTATTLGVLSVLLSGDEQLYGLKIAQETGLLTGTVYPILARLEQAGWVTSAWEEGDEPASHRGPRRRFYTLTPTGRQRAEAAIKARHARSPRARLVFGD